MVICQPGDVFHHDRLRSEILNEPVELKDQVVPLVVNGPGAVQSAEGREPLTSGAAGIGALSVVLKAYESIELGESVYLA